MLEDFEVFLAAQYSQLYRTAFLLTGDEHDARDLTQEALARVAARWKTLDKAGNPGGYAHTCLVRLNISRVRALRRMLVNDHVRLHANADEDAQADLRLDVAKAVCALPNRQRATVVLRFYQDMQLTEIADVMGCSVGTVKSQLFRALCQLQKSPWLKHSGPIRGVPYEQRS